MTIQPNEARRIIQIFEDDGDKCALCNDGTIWFWSVSSKAWKPWMNTVPQGDYKA